MRKANKNFISLAVVLIAELLVTITAFAEPISIAIGGAGLSGAGLFGSMAGASGLNINYTSEQVNDAMWNNLNPDSIYFNSDKGSETKVDPVTHTPSVYDYITLDATGLHDAMLNNIDEFITEYNVSDNSSGNTPIGPKSYNGYTFSNQIGQYYYGSSIGALTQGSQTFILGVLQANVAWTGSSWTITLYQAGVQKGVQSISTPNYGWSGAGIYWRCDNNGYISWVAGPNDFGTYASCGPSDSLASSVPSIPWTSGTINTAIFDGWSAGAKLSLPRSVSGLSDGFTHDQFIDAINNAWENGEQDSLTWVENEPGPVPPEPTPIPDIPLGNVPFDDWVDLWGQGIYQQLENQSDSLDFIGSNGEDQVEELESIDSNLEDLNQTAESIDTNIGTGIGLLGGIKSGIETAVDYLEGIAEHVGELVEEIVEGTETLIAGILNQIPTIFGVIFGPIKQASSIWHYVVEWIQSISAPMSWMWSMASGTSYNIVLPVYASLAGAVVLAFYKRFGK